LAGGVQMSTLGAGRAVWSRLTGTAGEAGDRLRPSSIRRSVRAAQREVRDARWIARGAGSAFGYPGRSAGTRLAPATASPGPPASTPAYASPTRPIMTLVPLKRGAAGPTSAAPATAAGEASRRR
jgi:hypothetical protein